MTNKAKKDTAPFNADTLAHLHKIGDLMADTFRVEGDMRSEISAIIADNPDFPSYLDGGKDSKELAAIKRELIIGSYSKDEIATYDRICAVEDRRKRPLQPGYPEYTRMVENAKKKAQYLRRVTKEVIAAAATGNGDMGAGLPRGPVTIREPWVKDGESMMRSHNRIKRMTDPTPEQLQYATDIVEFLKAHKKLSGVNAIISKLS